MESVEFSSLLDQLGDEIDDLEESLRPVFKTSLSVSSSTLPVLDKAKLFTVVTYAIESIIFSYLKLNGVNAREHAVFQELIRVKQYFDKIKAAESPAKKPSIGLDKEAAKRFIKASLRGNYTMDPNQVCRQASETTAHVKFQEDSKQHLNERQRSPLHTIGTSDESSGSDYDPTPQDCPSTFMNLPKKWKSESMIDSESISRAADLATSRDPKKRSRKKTEAIINVNIK